MYPIATIIGQVSLLSLLVVFGRLKSWISPAIDGRRPHFARLAFTLVVFAIALVASVHLTIVVGHHFLLSAFGVSYGKQFWQHFNYGTVELAAVARPFQVLAALCLWSLLPLLYLSFSGFVIRRFHLNRSRLLAIACFFTMTSSIYAGLYLVMPQLPSRLFIESAHAALGKSGAVRKLSDLENGFLREHGIFPISKAQPRFVGLKSNPLAKNLIVIYLEAFDLPYTNIDHGGFESLTPNINSFAQTAKVFQNWYPAAGYTIAALFGSHCGTKLDPGPTNGNAYLVEKFSKHTPIVCFTDLLKQAGFKNVFMGGASARFSGKGDFLLANGYDEAIGRDWFEKSNELKPKLIDWALLDYELFDQAAERVKELHQGDQRFLFTMLTFNTHTPGFQQDGVCGPYPAEAENDPLRKSAACTDKALGQFMAELESAGILRDTAVWIQSDHPQFQTELKQRALGDSNVANARLVSLLKLPMQHEQQVFDRPATAFDFPASALEVLGIDYTDRFQRGVSVLSPEFQARSRVLSVYGIHPSAVPAEPRTQESCPKVDADVPLASVPKTWTSCAFEVADQLASIDQQHAHARPVSPYETLRALRFGIDTSGAPRVWNAGDPAGSNILLHLSGSEFTMTEAEQAPYALEISFDGEIVNVRKLLLGQDPQCVAANAFLQISIMERRVRLGQCTDKTVNHEYAIHPASELRISL